MASANRSIEVLANVNPRGDVNGNIWVHADHAYMGSYGNAQSSCQSGVRVYSLRNPKRPRRVATFATPNGSLAGAYPDQVRIKSVRSAVFTGDLAAVGLSEADARHIAAYLYTLGTARAESYASGTLLELGRQADEPSRGEVVPGRR